VRRASLCSVVVGVGLNFGGLVSAASPAGAVPAWSIVPTPNPTALSVAELSGVSCPTATNCTAVGVRGNSAFTTVKALIEHWNGTTWTMVPTDLTVPTASHCTAVGADYGSTSAAPLAEQYG
jgi:hypothetical protein